MATRPIFVPIDEGRLLVNEIPIEFRWHPGRAPSQKKKNIDELHYAAKRRGYGSLLEISSKSSSALGKRLSAFSLKTPIGNERVFVECAYQGSKVFERGGPFFDLYKKTPIEAKKDERIRKSGELIKFRIYEEEFPISPKNAFYDWLYLRALAPHVAWIKDHYFFDGYTDIEFNPKKSVNCQARAFAEFISLMTKEEVEKCACNFSYFSNFLKTI